MANQQSISGPFTVNQAASELGITPRAVRDLISLNQLNAFDVSQCPGKGKARWRITPEAISDFVDRRTYRPTAQPPRRRSVRRATTQHV